MVPIDSVVKYWVRKNNCNSVPTTSAVPNSSVTDGCTADHFVYASGASGSTVELYRVNAGAHTWPGAPFPIGVTNQDFSASKEIWRFFRPFKLNLLTSAIEVDKQNLNFSLFPNPATNQLQFNFDGYNQQRLSIEIVDIFGKIVLSEHHHSNNIQVGQLNSGLYFITISENGKQLVKEKFIKE
jgi:polyhydroxybutyrate depolymerase